uniref:TMF_TATA_bd domain-containing protein n=1 Tax=Echinostoma caproni TaxID=27848 RepID=A0A183AMN3_9TREM
LWSSRVAQLQAELDDSRVSGDQIRSTLRERLQKSLEAQQTKDTELRKLQTLLDTASRAAEEKLEKIERLASVREQALQTKIAQLTQSLTNTTLAKECLEDKLAQQLKANEAYRKATEDELDELRDKLSTLSASTACSIAEKAHEHSLVEERLNTEIAQLKQLNEEKTRHAAQLQGFLEKSQAQLTTQSQQLKDALALSESRKMELNDLRSDHSQTRIQLLELQDQRNEAQDRLKHLEHTVSDLETRLSESDVERTRTENRCTRLASQITELETQMQQKTDRLRDLQILIDFTQQEKADFERRSIALHEQLRQMESDWMQSRDQLAQTRTALAQALHQQHETTLQLMQVKFNYAQATERLALLQADDFKVRRAFRSALALYPHSRPTSLHDCSTVIDTPLHEVSTIFDNPVSDRLHMSTSGIMSCTMTAPVDRLDTTESEGIDGTKRSLSRTSDTNREEVAVQTNGTLVSRRDAQVSCSVGRKFTECGLKSVLWPPYADVTAPVSPAGLRNNDVLSGASPQRHLRRFCRLIIAPDEEQTNMPLNDMLSRPIPQDVEVDKEAGEPVFSSPSKRSRAVSPLQSSQSVMPTASASRNTADDSRLSTQTSSDPIPYIPETPLPWNATSTSCIRSFSAYDIAKYPVATHHLTIQVDTLPNSSESNSVQTAQPVRQPSWNHTPRSQSKKISRFWKGNKLRKFSGSGTTNHDPADRLNQSGPEVFRKPPAPLPSKHNASKLAPVTDNAATSITPQTPSRSKHSKLHGIFPKPH